MWKDNKELKDEDHQSNSNSNEKSSISSVLPSNNLVTILPNPSSLLSNQNNRIKFIVLVLLCCQNAGHALLARYSQGVLKEDYSSTEVVIFAELIKFIFSGYVAVTDHAESDAAGKGFLKLLWLLSHAEKIVILVILYSASNILSYYALARVDAAAYTVVLQLKIFTTAAFAVIMLGRIYSNTKWRALILLVLGCILVASPTFNRPPECDYDSYIQTQSLLSQKPSLSITDNNNSNDKNSISSKLDVALKTVKLIRRALQIKMVSDGADLGKSINDEPTISIMESMLGLGSVIVMVIMSGYSSIYFEGMLKQGAKITIWERNFQLAFYSILFLCVIAAWESSSSINTTLLRGSSSEIEISNQYFIYIPFRGWSIVTFMIALLQAGGGLLVAATLKYADAVLKTLATSGSIVLSAVIGYLLLGGTLDIFVTIGSVATILAIFNYTLDP